MPKIKFLLQPVEFRIAETVFMSPNRTSLNRFKTRAAELSFIRFSIH